MASGARALFFDRDGIINVDKDYVYRREDFVWCDGIFELGETAIRLGYGLFVVTNQSGIGRGLYTEEDFTTLTDWMCAEMALRGAPVQRVYHCPYHPEAHIARYRAVHPWRKPAPGMILQARDDFGLDLGQSILIGDRSSDMQAAASAGVGARVLVRRGAAQDQIDPPPTLVASDLREVIAWLVERNGQRVKRDPV